MTDVFLIQPPIRDFYLTVKRTIPYGLASIAGALIHAGFSVGIFDALANGKTRPRPLPREMGYLEPFYGRPDRSPFGLFHGYRHFGYSFDRIGRSARDSGAFLVGISSLFTPYSEEALLAAEAVRRYHPGCKIVLGGHHPTALPETVLASPAVDFVLRGEGEEAMVLLTRALRDGTGMREIPGLCVKTETGRQRITEPAVVKHLDRLPPPATDLLENRFYRRGRRGSAVISASRGCPMNCSYCSVGATSFLPYRRRSVDSVLTEIETDVVQHGARFIDFEDENLALNGTWFLSLLGKMPDRLQGMDIELRAMNGLFPPSLNDDIVRAMKQAGFRCLNLALGSTSAAQLRRFNRPDVRPAFDRALSLAEAHDMDAVGYIIVGAPFQSAETSLEDLLFLARRRVLAGVSVYYPAPASPDYRQCEKLSLLPPAFSLMRASSLPLDHTTSRTEAVTLLRLGRIVNFMKSLADRGISIPRPRRPEDRISDTADRLTVGLKLLSWYFFDRNIRGITPDGTVFDHRIDRALAAKFTRAIEQIPIHGVSGQG